MGTKWEHSPREEQLELVKNAAKTAFADDFIESLPQGYDTRIGERGGLLSGGQKQRVAIARSIISEPKILLLDEATSALDPHAEGIVQQALDRASRNRTTIVIAHKLKTIRDADNIVVLSKGVIVEQGKHDDLVAAGSTYASLVRAQDLSGAAPSDDSDSDDTPDNTVEQDAEKVRSLARYTSNQARELQSLKDREDFAMYKKSGLVASVVKVLRATWSLKLWYTVVLIACIAGGLSSPPFRRRQRCLYANAWPQALFIQGKPCFWATFWMFSRAPTCRVGATSYLSCSSSWGLVLSSHTLPWAGLPTSLLR